MYDLVQFSAPSLILKVQHLQSTVAHIPSQNVMQQNQRYISKKSLFVPPKKNISEFLHLKLNQLLMTLFGLWPYQSKSSKRRNFSIFVMAIASITVPFIQGLAEMAIFDTIMFFGTILGMLWVLGSLVISATLYVNRHSIRKLYQKIQMDYQSMKNPDDLAIMKIFSREARTSTFTFIGCGMVAGSVFLILNCSPLMFENEDAYSAMFSTYSYRWIIHDRIQRFQVLIHIFLLLCYCAMSYTTALYVYLYSIKHICGMFTIVSLRLQNLIKPRNIKPSKKTDGEIISELLKIINMHKEAIKSTEIVRKTYCKIYIALQISALFILAILIFALQLSANMKSAHLAFRAISMITIFMQYILYVNYGGQQIIDYSSKVFETTYLMGWDSLSPKVRKILFMIILRSYRPSALICGTFTLSMANVTKIINMSWSLATVLWSTQKNA